MTEYELKVPGQLLSSLLSHKIGLVELLESILNPILEAQAVEPLGAERYERSEERMVLMASKLTRITEELCGVSFSKSAVC